MSVRWKPMIFLSALFVVLAAAGLLAITSVLGPGGAEEILGQARAEARAKKYDRAKIQFERALQREPRNAAIHLEYASMLAAWADQAPDQRAKNLALWRQELANAAKHGSRLKEPRRELLADALRREDSVDSLYWAKELDGLDAENPDVAFVIAADALENRPPDLEAAKRRLTLLESRQPKRARTVWLRARVAELSKDGQTLGRILAESRGAKPQADPVDRMAGLRLRLIDLTQATAPAVLAERVAAFRGDIQALRIDPSAPGRVRQVSLLLERAQKHLTGLAARQAEDRAAIEKLGDELEVVARATYEKAIETTGEADLRPHLAYAEYLLLRGHRDRCLETAAAALKRPVASQAHWLGTTMELREVAIKAALADSADAARFDKAAPFIRDLLASTDARYKALGHLFQGVIDLERSGLADTSARESGAAVERKSDSKFAASAVTNLKAAAEGLKDVPTAQALYGVALILTREPALGRQYLQKAHGLGGGDLDPRYQIWAAWSVLQAGYPEDAEPIVGRLLGQVERGEQAAELASTLHLLQGEIHQARRTPEDLRKARDEYRRAIEAGMAATPALQLRIAQLDARLGDRAKAMEQIDRLSRDQEAGPSAEQLAILTLREKGQKDEAAARLAAARKRFPESAELAGLDAAILLDAKKPQDADRILAEFLARHPDQLELTLFRARVLAASLGKRDEARTLLAGVADRAESSVPLVQLALLDLAAKDYESVSRSIARLRERWPEAAAADLLDAQLAFARGNPTGAATHLDAALKKDPKNKVAMFWKGQLDDLNGASSEAQKVFEEIVKERPVKELDAGLPLTAAAQWALASMDLEKQDFQGAISRFEALLQDGDAAELGRPVRWKLALARAGRGEVERAKSEIEALLREPATTPQERVQAADFFRTHGDDAAAERQLDLVLKADPAHSGAVAYRAMMWTDRKRDAEAASLVRKATAAGKQPAGLYLLLAAIENRSGSEGIGRALAALDDGLKLYPDSAELIKARYELMKLSKDPRAAEFVERKAEADPKGPARRILAEVYRAEGRLADAEQVVAKLLDEQPADSPAVARLSAERIGLILAQASEAGGRGDQAAADELNRKAFTLIAKARERFPRDLAFPQLECELSARTGDLPRAKRLAGEMAEMDKASPVGPLLSGRLAAATGQFDEAARGFEAALSRAPARADVRLELGKVRLAAGKYDDAVEQATAVLDVDKDAAEAVLLKAQALSSRRGAGSAATSGRAEAARLLQAAIQSRPQFIAAYHLLADIQAAEGRRDQALDTLRRCLRAVSDDDAGVSLLVQRLAEPLPDGKPAPARDVEEAKGVAEKYGTADERGVFCLALAVGFQKAGRSDLAARWAEKAAAKLERPIVHLTYGDILLSLAESTDDSSEARGLFARAVDQYDAVLKKSPDSVEAVNNKAWILHRYLDQNAKALELAQGLARRVDAKALPAEFYDTLGAIQEAMGQAPEAEKSFAEGLRRSPDHPILNFHMGRALLRRPDRAREARQYLEKARKARESLPSSMATEVDNLLAKAGR